MTRLSCMSVDVNLDMKGSCKYSSKSFVRENEDCRMSVSTATMIAWRTRSAMTRLSCMSVDVNLDMKGSCKYSASHDNLYHNLLYLTELTHF